MSDTTDILKEVFTAGAQPSFPTVYKLFKTNDVQLHDFYAKAQFSVYTLSASQSDFQMVIDDKTANINYFKNYLKFFLPEDSSLTAIYWYDIIYGNFSFGQNAFGDDGQPYGLDDYTYLYTYELGKRYFGDFITSPTNFIVDETIIQDNSNSSLFHSSDERWYRIIFNSYRQVGIFDLYTGILYLFSLDSLSQNYYTLTYYSNQLRKELNINCSIQPEEFTFSTNPSAIDDETDYLEKLHTENEILKNGGLELGDLQNWSAEYCSLTSSTLTANVYSGIYSLQANFVDSSSGVDSIISYLTDLSNTPVRINENIRAECYFKKGSFTADENFILEIQQYNGSSFVTTQSKTVSLTSVPQNEWYRVIVYDQVQYIDQLKVRIRIDDNPIDFSSIYIDNLSLKIQRDSLNKSNLYLTTLGFYNDSNDLLMIAKLAKPLRKSSYPLVIKVRADLV